MRTAIWWRLMAVALVTLIAACGNGDGVESEADSTAPDDTASNEQTSEPDSTDAGDDADSGELESVIFATGSTTGGTHFANFEIGIPLGFYAEEGLEVEILHAGGNAPATAELEAGNAEFAVGTPSFQVNNYAETGGLPGVNYFEYTYPMKWELLVRPDSPIADVSDLAGTVVGIHSLGTADEAVITEWLGLGGVSADEVELVVTGGGIPAGVALQDGDVDAILAWDTHRGAYDAEGIEYRQLPRPDGVSEFGGFFIQATPEYLEANREEAVGFARAVLKSTIFALENPEAAMALYLDAHPELGDGMTREEAVENLVTTARYRMANWAVPYPDLLQGEIPPHEWENEIAFAGLTEEIEDPTIFYTNDLIEEINEVDLDAVRELAKDYDWSK